MFEQKDNTGFLFTNEDRVKNTHPHLLGNIKLEGSNYSISAWWRTSKKTGKKFLSIKINPTINSSTENFPAVGSDGEPQYE